MPRESDENSLSGLPEEWGEIHIPDDAAELEPLAIEVRRELRKAHRREMRLPYLVLVVTVIITLMSMFLVPLIGTTGRVEPSPAPSTPGCTTDCDSPADNTTSELSEAGEQPSNR